MEVSIIILALIVGISFVVAAIGFAKRSGVPVMTAGLVIMLAFLMTDTVITGTQSVVASTTETGGTVETSSVIFDTEHSVSDNIAISEKTNKPYDIDTVDSAIERPNCTNCSDTRHAILIGASSSLIGESIQSVVIRARLENIADAGTVNIEHRNSIDTVLATATVNMNVFSTAVGGSETTVTFASPITLASGDRIVIRNTQDTTNFIWVQFANADLFDGVNTKSQSYAGAYSDYGSDLTGELSILLKADNVRDDAAGTVWENSVAEESGAYIYADLGSAVETHGMKLNHQELTKMPATIKLYASDDPNVFGALKDTFTLTAETGLVEYGFDVGYTNRYFKIQVDTWSTADNWQIAEFELWNGTITTVTETTPIETDYEYDTVSVAEEIPTIIRVLSVFFGIIVAAVGLFRYGLSL